MSDQKTKRKKSNRKPGALRQARDPRRDPEDRQSVTKGDLEDVFSRLASVPPTTKSENREPTRQELNRRYKLVRRS